LVFKKAWGYLDLIFFTEEKKIFRKKENIFINIGGDFRIL